MRRTKVRIPPPLLDVAIEVSKRKPCLSNYYKDNISVIIKISNNIITQPKVAAPIIIILAIKTMVIITTIKAANAINPSEKS
jgi:hypothetical protein